MITQTTTRRIEPDITILAISGRLNLGNTLMSIETAARRLIQDGVRKLVLDVAAVTYIDSSGIGMLVGLNGEMEQQGGQMRIAGAAGAVATSFTVVHLDRVVLLDADVESACRILAGAPGASA
jgi:anti-sigma B factor antagonist